MTPQEFADRATGINGPRWVRWASTWEQADCYGIVILYHREVLGIELGPVPQTDIASGFVAARGWQDCGPEPGSAAFMAWLDNQPAHCGIVLPGGMVLHAQGSVESGGCVRATRLRVMASIYSTLTFHRYVGC